MANAITAIVVVLGLVGGLGGVGVAIAWLNDRRHIALARSMPQQSPREILEKRFAKGEIDEAEFNKRMSRLMIGPTLELD